MNSFDPGPGWREETSPPVPNSTVEVRYWDGTDWRYWVREAPSTFTLPTEQYAVIRVTWAKGARKGAEDVLVNYLGGWCDLDGTIYTRPDVASSISGFEVLAEPRNPMTAATLASEYARGRLAAEQDAGEIARVTAKAVLDRIASEPWAREVDLTRWRREFGVDA